MNRIYGFFLVCLLSMTASAQQLNCEVVINAELTGGQNISVFKTLENALREFVNQMDTLQDHGEAYDPMVAYNFTPEGLTPEEEASLAGVRGVVEDSDGVDELIPEEDVW